MFVCSVQLISVLDSQSKFQMLTLFTGRHIGVPQHGGTILGSVNLRGIFRRISQLWDNAQA